MRSGIRGWLSSLAAGAVLGGAVLAMPLGAAAQSPLDQVFQQRPGEWADGFDSGRLDARGVRTISPILSPEVTNAMAYAIQRYSDIVMQGGWPIVPADKTLKIGVRDPSVALLRQRLMISGDLPQGSGISDIFDSYVEAAVRHFQARHGIPADGVIGPTSFAALNVPATVRLQQLQINLERLEKLAGQTPDRYVVVNIPGAEVEAVEGGRVVSRHTAVVGKVDRPSPLVNSRINEIRFRPFWTVPVSIVRRDLIPLMQKNPNYLAEQHIHIYDQRGNELQPSQIDWNTNDAVNYMFRQDPGDFNSLGSVKINFPSPDGVYMHDTPHKELFGSEYRFDSSGCVRVQNIRELITWILRDTPGWTRDQVEAQFRSEEQLSVPVVNPVQLYWVYITAWAREDGVVQFRNDIYLQDGSSELALQ